MSLIIDFSSPCDNHILTFEDDGKVAYGYLRTETEIVGDVWLYNRCRTPDLPEWKDKNNIPFANSTEYVSCKAQYKPRVTLDDVKVTWEYEEEVPCAYIYVHDNLIGVVGVGDKPGYSRFAIKDGPLGLVMDIE